MYISHSLKCFSQTYTWSFSIWFLKFTSTTLSFVMTFSISLLHFFVVSSLTVGILNRLICLWRQFEEQPTNAQFSPGITARLKLNISKNIQLFCRLKLNISKDNSFFVDRRVYKTFYLCFSCVISHAACFFSLCRSRSLGTTTNHIEKDNQLTDGGFQTIFLLTMVLLFYFSKAVYAIVSRENGKFSLGFSYNQNNVKLLF